MKRISAIVAAGFALVGHAANLAPEQALRQMVAAPGLEVKLIAAEPQVRQPISVRFDGRGRLWVLQYLQYPHPAGLKAVKVDEWLRTEYDRVPEPPPNGPKGADRITICDQPDADGRMHHFQDFISDGNLISGFALGYGGVYVMQPPYLLYYRSREDRPEGPPQVLLKGFGLQDTHALANNLQFGPDGWLYGAQGSTVTSDVAGHHFSQCIWRFHPRTHAFEVFAEGGGNTWGLDFDAHGNAIAGSNYGGHIALHQVQGGYYVKTFEKHGALSNPYTFGYFQHMPSPVIQGGHINNGGLIYQGGALPERFNGAYIAANVLSNGIYWHRFERDGSSFRLLTQGEFMMGHDPKYRPIYLGTGPDGAIYVVDWYDERLSHGDPRDNVDKTNGRIFRIQSQGARQIAPLGLDSLDGEHLVALLANRNEWYARMARQLLAERHDAQVYPLLRRQIAAQRGPLALESLWTLYASGGWDSGFALKCLDHANEDVRAWTVRLLGDAGKVNPAMAERLALLAQTEPSAVVRNQLACSAKRLPGPDALPIIAALLHRDADVGDPMIPLLLWWALENKAVSDRDAVLAMWQQPETWTAPMARKFITERLARRYAQEGGSENLRSCARLLDLAPDPGARDEVLSGMSQAYDGRVLPAVPPELAAAVEHLWEQGKPSGLLIRFAARVGSPEGLSRAHAMAADSNEPFGQRVAAITLLGQAGDEQSEAVLLNIAEGSAPDGASQGGGSQAAPDAPVSPSEALRADALAALSAFSDPALARRLITLYPRLSPALRQKARASLEARPSSALALLRAVDSGALPAGEIPLAEVRPMSALGGEALASLILKHYGKVTAQAAGVQRSMAREVEDIVLLRVHHTDWKAGRETFRRTCSACHTLFGEGGHIGPDLTTVDRQSVEFLAANIVAPSLTIRPEFIAYNVTLKDGRVLNGFLASADDETVAVRDVADHVTTVPRSQVAKLEGSSVSLMPEGLLEAMTAQQIADLFAYIQRRSASGN